MHARQGVKGGMQRASVQILIALCNVVRVIFRAWLPELTLYGQKFNISMSQPWGAWYQTNVQNTLTAQSK